MLLRSIKWQSWYDSIYKKIFRFRSENNEDLRGIACCCTGLPAIRYETKKNNIYPIMLRKQRWPTFRTKSRHQNGHTQNKYRKDISNERL